jgi:hypothetical protein
MVILLEIVIRYDIDYNNHTDSDNGINDDNDYDSHDDNLKLVQAESQCLQMGK